MFDSLRYIYPVWYYHIVNNTHFPIWYDIDKLNPEIKKKIRFDSRYTSYAVSKLDASWQLFNLGYISNDMSLCLNIDEIFIEKADEYLFLSKYFSKQYLFQYFILSVFKHKNIFKELKSFISNFKIEKFEYQYIEHKCFENFLVNSSPLIAIIIPTLNRYEYLKDCLVDLENQIYKNFVVIVVDQSDQFDEEFYTKFNLSIKVIRQKEKGLCKARNRAINSLDAEFYLLFDDDSRVNENWINNHLKAIFYFNCGISSGKSPNIDDFNQSKGFYNSIRFKFSEQLDTGNALISKEVFKKIGLIDLQFEKMVNEDSEFGLRASLAGFKIVSNSTAYRIHMKASSGGLREFGSIDGYRIKKIFTPRPLPSIFYYSRKYYGSTNAKILMIKGIFNILVPHKYKKTHPIKKVFFLFPFLLFSPIIIYQMLYSWKLSSRMLKEGSKIPNYKF